MMKRIVMIGFCLWMANSVQAADTPPNVVVLFVDDMGYADIGPFGCDAYKTPHLDQMAAEGRKFTDFHAATAVCSASRAALLTGCYPERVVIRGALYPVDRHGLNPTETSLDAGIKKHKGVPLPPLPLYDGEKVIDANVTPADQAAWGITWSQFPVKLIAGALFPRLFPSRVVAFDGKKTHI